MPALEAVDLEGIPQLLRDLREIAPWLLTSTVVILGARFAAPPLLEALAKFITACKGK